MRVPQVDVDFAPSWNESAHVRAAISPHDSAKRFTELGVDVFLGEGRIHGPGNREVGGARLRFKRAVITTGARADATSYSGMREAGLPD